MSEHRTLRSFHLVSTIWFIVCIGYIFVLALRQAGFKWWVIFSLSGHSALLIFLMISLYLFAMFRGVSRTQQIEVEHPLTSADYYMFFYAGAPFLGSLAGCIGMIGTPTASQFMLGISLGTLGTTFLAWVVIDPLTGLVETVLPTSRKHRMQRLAQAEEDREMKREARERLLADVFQREKSNHAYWHNVLEPQAERLTALIASNRIDDLEQVEREAVDIGTEAWQLGGLSCMRQLRDIAVEIADDKTLKHAVGEYISLWWDGIGAWRNPSLV